MIVDMYLVDSSAWILALRKEAIQSVKNRVGELLRDDKILANGMITLELLGGTRTRKEFRRLKERLGALDMVPIDAALWVHAADFAFTLRRKGLTIPYTDVLIAACALQADATLVHADRHFDLIADHTQLKVESYVHLLTSEA